MSTKTMTYAEAINDALHVAMDVDESVICYGLGVPDPKGVFGTTLGLQERFGEDRVFDTPTAENAMMGVGVGAAIGGLRPVIISQRLDFFLLAMDQLVNNAAKWHYMFGGQASVPVTVRLIVGRGWGQGPTHSQNLQAWFAHIPGVKVVNPALASDARDLLIASIFDDNPVVFIEHRWLHNTKGYVSDDVCIPKLGGPRVVVEGQDITIVASSYMTLEALRAVQILEGCNVSAEVIDLRVLSPLDDAPVVTSVLKTGRLLVVDSGTRSGGLAADIAARVTECAMRHMVVPPQRVALPDHPTPTSRGLTEHCYPRSSHIALAVLSMLGRVDEVNFAGESGPFDIPDNTFRGPF